MWAKFCETMLMVGTVWCICFAWPIRTQWHGLDYGLDMHSWALTAAGVALVFAYHSIRSLRKEVASLRDRGSATQPLDRPIA